LGCEKEFGLDNFPISPAKAAPKSTGPIAEPARGRGPVCRYCTDPDCDNPLFCASYEPAASPTPAETAHMDEFLEGLDLPLTDMWGNALFSTHTLLQLQIGGYSVSLVLHPNERILLGRVEADESGERVLDLSPYEAHQHGVSRVHAAISHVGHTLTLTDVGSTNGTYINEQHLVARQPRILRDGDILRLGSLVIQVNFK
jgi:predicted component of type VI protein secretion system